MHLDPMQVVAQLDLPAERGGRQRAPVILLTERDAGHVVGEDEDAHACPAGGGGGLLDRGVVVTDIADALLRHGLDLVLADHRVQQRRRACGQLVEAGARQVSPASTTDASACSTRNPIVGAIGRWSVGATRVHTVAVPTTPSVCSCTWTGGGPVRSA